MSLSTDFAAMTRTWSDVEREAARLARTRLIDLFAADEARAEALTFEAPHLVADFCKQRIDGAALAALGGLADAARFDDWRRAMFAGEIVNTTEGRPAMHWKLRVTDPPGGIYNGPLWTDFIAEI